VSVRPRTELPRAGRDDIKVLSRVIAAAFHDLAPSTWLIADPGERSAIFPPYCQIFVEMALAEGVVFTNPERSAAALWLNVRAGHDGSFSGYDDRLAAAVGRHVDRFRTFDRLLEERHPDGVDYCHLAMLAVRPDRHRQGIGTTLLSGSHQILDAAGTPCYLEASDSGTRSIYLRHGYADRGEPIQFPAGPCMYPMWREPKD
jgi:GNAT superfamily N-acetyltransferase